MRIVLVNWAPIWDGARFGGGVNGYCQSLALELVERGHEVVSLFGGLVYVPRPRHCFVRRHDDWLGVRIFEVINSPVLAPSMAQFAEPAGEIAQPELERVLSNLFCTLRPDAVHWHNVEGFSAGCVSAAKRSGARVIYSLHNYHTLCPQVTLTREHRWACHDFDAGRSCETCVKSEPPAVERARREADYQRRHAEESAAGAGERLRAEWGSFKHELSWPKRIIVKAARVAHAALDVRRLRAGPDGGIYLPGRPVVEAADVRGARPHRGDESRGQAAAIAFERSAPPVRDPRDKPVLNILQPRALGAPGNAYATRRRAMVEMLASCDKVLAVSSFVREMYASMGVPGDRIETMPIGSRIVGVARRHRELLFDPPPFDERPATQQRPVRLVFLGYNHFNKGLPLLAEALGLLSADVSRAIDLSVFALGGETIEWRFRRLEPRLARLSTAHGYQIHDIPWCLGGKDLTYVGSTWWDPGPQTVFESFACGVPVLGAALGGIPDFVRHDHNGLLFRGNDAASLADQIAGIVARPERLNRLRANVRPPKDMAEHAAELERTYCGDVLPGGSPYPVGGDAILPIAARRPAGTASAGR
ncbi:MAG: glycosyltransferase [Phycisphaeraceae bacterium]|nr:glycosyltransferase [Phycisphaeraceae bacterium]